MSETTGAALWAELYELTGPEDWKKIELVVNRIAAGAKKSGEQAVALTVALLIRNNFTREQIMTFVEEKGAPQSAPDVPS